MHEDKGKRRKEKACQSVCDRERLVVLFRTIIPKTKQEEVISIFSLFFIFSRIFSRFLGRLPADMPLSW